MLSSMRRVTAGPAVRQVVPELRSELQRVAAAATDLAEGSRRTVTIKVEVSGNPAMTVHATPTGVHRVGVTVLLNRDDRRPRTS